jgi:hypothetical protein
MTVPFYSAPQQVQLVELILVVAPRGAGTPDNPIRSVSYYYHPKDGRLLAMTDPLDGEVDRAI